MWELFGYPECTFCVDFFPFLGIENVFNIVVLNLAFHLNCVVLGYA